MITYITMNYKTVMDRARSDRKMEEIVGILLVSIILCHMVASQKTEMPLREVVAEDSYIFGETVKETGDMSVLNSMDSDCLFSADFSDNNISEKYVPLITKAGDHVDFDDSAGMSEEMLSVSLLADTGADLEETAGELLITEKELSVVEKPETIIEELVIAPVETVAVPEELDAVPAVPVKNLEEPATVPADSLTVSEEPVKEEEASFVNYNGFVCDLSGKIIGCDGVLVTDGVLCLPSDGICTGVATGAFASLSESVYEIYIPENIIAIEAGAFDGLSELLYIEVHPDNPVYQSSFGVLSEK